MTEQEAAIAKLEKQIQDLQRNADDLRELVVARGEIINDLLKTVQTQSDTIEELIKQIARIDI